VTEAKPPQRLGRSAGALMAGIAAGVALSLGTDIGLRALGIFSPLGQRMASPLFLLATAYRIVYGVVASYIIAWLAPNRRMHHALAGGVLGLAASTVGAVATWNKTELGPHWYPVALALTALPCAWLGGVLYLRKASRTMQNVGD
jgi:hypothetical protein